MRTISLLVVAASAINCRKSKTLSLTRNANGLQVGGEQIEAVDKFTYLGSDIDASGSTDLNIENKIKKSQICLAQCESEHWPKTEAI